MKYWVVPLYSAKKDILSKENSLDANKQPFHSIPNYKNLTPMSGTALVAIRQTKTRMYKIKR